MDSLYRDHILEHARYPRNFGILADATHSSRQANPTCGDICTISLKIVGDAIVEVKWDGHGCALSTAAASLLTEHLIGGVTMPRLNESEFLTLLGIEPTSGRLDCALLPLRVYLAALK
ncbi:TPA: Fe-S cluster protein [Candidatus Uhrbacteria bacterium]|nr:Fe-S cluster protein [Candidatus Uhrbacteria bacterium]